MDKKTGKKVISNLLFTILLLLSELAKSQTGFNPLQIASIRQYLTNSTDIALIEKATINQSLSKSTADKKDLLTLANEIKERLRDYRASHQEFNPIFRLKLLSEISQLLHRSQIIAMPLVNVTLPGDQSYLVTRIDKKSAIALAERYGIELPIIMIDGYAENFHHFQQLQQDMVDEANNKADQVRLSYLQEQFSDNYNRLSLEGRLTVLDIVAAATDPHAGTQPHPLLNDAIKLQAGIEGLKSHINGVEFNRHLSTDLLTLARSLIESYSGSATVLNGLFILDLVELERIAIQRSEEKVKKSEQSLLKSEMELSHSERQLIRSENRLQKMEDRLYQSRIRLSQTVKQLRRTKDSLSKSEHKLSREKRKLHNSEELLHKTTLYLDKIKTSLHQSKKKLRRSQKSYLSTEQQLEVTKLQLSKLEKFLESTEKKLKKNNQSLQDSDLKLNRSIAKQKKIQQQLNYSESRLEKTEKSLKRTHKRIARTTKDLQQLRLAQVTLERVSHLLN